MKVFKILACAILLSFFNLNLIAQVRRSNNSNTPIKALLIDCSGSQEYKYDPFIKIAESVGIKFDYKPIEQVLDNGESFAWNEYKAAFFSLGITMLKTLGRSTASNKILNLISNFYKNTDITLGLILPSIGAKQGNKVPVLFPLFTKMGLLRSVGVANANVSNNTLVPTVFQQAKPNQNVKLQLNDGVNLFLNAVNSFLNVPLESRPLRYDTSLKLPSSFMFNVEPAFSAFSFPILVLPENKYFNKAVTGTLPYGIYWFDSQRRNNIFVTSSTLCTFSGISENFQFCPMDFKERARIQKAVQQTLFELKNIINTRVKSFHLPTTLKKLQAPNLPDSVSKLGSETWDRKVKNYFKKIGWMELNAFEEPIRKKDQTDIDYEKAVNERKIQQPILIDDIYKSGLDALWVTFNPQMYYSPIGVRKGFENRFLNSVGLFTKSLKEKAKELNVEIPKILIGYEIANNIYPPNLPENYSVDLYGNEYQDLPSALDKDFWNNEIKNSLITFLSKWKQPKIGNGLKLSGVVLDLEMYMRKQSGSFLNTMGFEDNLISKFKDQTTLSRNAKNLQGLQFLLRNKKVTQYYKFLQKGAEQIGKDLRDFFNKNLEESFISCYAPNISVDWFYLGFYKGLCDKNNTIELMTFNTEFASHQTWLNQHGINASHASVLMLSKLKNQSSFNLVDDILKHNYGVWLNRFSRFAEKFDAKAWYSIEQTPMNNQDKEIFFNYLKGK